MFDIEKAKAYDKIMMKLAESKRDLVTAQGQAYVAGLYGFNERFIKLQQEIQDLKKELAETFVKMEES